MADTIVTERENANQAALEHVRQFVSGMECLPDERTVCVMYTDGDGEPSGGDDPSTLTLGDLRALAGSGWQPIETAPRDGREVLVFDQDIFLARWTAGYDNIMHEEWEFFVTDAFDKIRNPTHWMPVPPSPSRAALRKAGGNANG